MPRSSAQSTPDLVVVSHSGARAGAPMVLLHLLGWLQAKTSLDTRVVLLHGGSMESEFERFGAHVIGGHQSRMWMLQRGFTNLGHPRAATALAFARQAPTMIAASKASLVLLNSAGSLPAVRFMPKQSQSKLVLYLHELDESLDRTLGTAAWNLLSPRIDHFLTCSTQVTEMLVERKGIPRHRITEHPGFVEPRAVEPIRREYVRRQLGIPPDALVVGACGSAEWRKGPELFVRMAARLHRQRPDLDPHFVWLGGLIDESPGWKIRHDVESAGLTGRFHLAGEVRRPEEVMDLYDVFALTSREDPYPLAMLEAASLGAPMVSFDNGGATQFAQEGTGSPLAVIVPYLDVPAMTDAISGLLDHPDERRELGGRARDHVLAQRTTDRAAPRLLQTLIGVEPALAGRAPQPLGQSARSEPTVVAVPTLDGVPVPDAGPNADAIRLDGQRTSEMVVLVDGDNVDLGTCEKLEAHQPPGQLHRAISVFVLRNDGRIVLQRRAASKYHFGDLWANSCCTHPRPGESIVDAGQRRLHEELGMQSQLRFVGSFTYRATDPLSGLVEHELDHVLVGRSSDVPEPNPAEVSETRELSIAELREAIARSPHEYTPWLAEALQVLTDTLPDNRTGDRPNDLTDRQSPFEKSERGEVLRP